MWAACLLAAAVCGQTTITGSYGSLVLDGDAGPFVIESPAAIADLTVFNAASVQIQGGRFGDIDLYGTSLEFFGGESIGVNKFRIDRLEGGTDLTFHVRSAIVPPDPDAKGQYVSAWLLNGDYIAGPITRPVGQGGTINYVFYDLPVDPTEDGFFGIEDLNLIRNEFGGMGAADIDQSGQIDIGDLNIVRNHFGQGFPAEVRAVPEPSGVWLLWVALAATAVRFGIGRR